MKNFNKKNKGFTLIEILVVIGIIAILAAIVIIAINPARQFAQARNSQRTANVNAILNAIGQYTADNKGELPADLPSGDSEDFDDYEQIASGAGNADICDDLIPNYMPAIPVDPATGDGAISDCGGAYSTGYTVIIDDETSRISVCAENAADEEALDDADEICVTR